MKKETEELIDWIKKQMSLAKDCCIRPAWGENHETYNKDFEAAVAFLDSLSKLERRLCLGGYIQDSDGVPCCDGDRIDIKLTDKRTGRTTEYKKALLTWAPDMCMFHFTAGDGSGWIDRLIFAIEFYKVGGLS